MPCSATPDADKRLAQLDRRQRQLDAQLSLFRELAGVSESPSHQVVNKLSAEYSSGTSRFTIVFQSQPGESYQAAVSTDGVNFADTGTVIPAAASPAVSTSWMSATYSPGQLPRYFRIRRYPVAMAVCDPQPVVCPTT